MMKFSVLKWLLLMTVGFQWTSVGGNTKGFVLTGPLVFDSSSTERLCVTFNEVRSYGFIRVKLVKGARTFKEIKVEIRRGEGKCFDFDVPAITESKVDLAIEGKFGAYLINAKTSVKIRQTSDITLIQTDKHIYKGGQADAFYRHQNIICKCRSPAKSWEPRILIRIFRITPDFRPSSNKIKSVVIETPYYVRVYDNAQLVTNLGIIDLTFPLTKETELGTWTICVIDEAGHKTNKTFKVQEYVLPQFSVNVIPPTVIQPNFNQFQWRVCSYYTYGGEVKGQVKAKITQSKKTSNTGNDPETLVRYMEDQISGCLTMTVNRGDFNLAFQQYTDPYFLNFHADVIEHGTDIKITDVQQREVKVSPLNVYIVSKPHFKPGLPYIVKILVEDYDDNPVRNEELSLQVTTINRRNVEVRDYQYKKFTDMNGLAMVTIAKQDDTIENLVLKITMKNFPTKSYVYFGFRRSAGAVMTQNSKSEKIKSWHSPSNSYVKIEGKTQPLPCNRVATIEISGVLSDDDDLNGVLTMYYQVMSRNNVLTQNNMVIRKKSTKSYKFTLPLKIEPSMSPRAELLVYYIRYDGEIVSDSETFAIDGCFENQVEMKFGTESVLPGESADLQVTVSAKSLCSIFMTDKSTELLSRRVFNPHKIFNIVKNQPINTPVSIAEDQCTTTNRQLGTLMRNTNVVGSKAAFHAIGMVALTDLNLELNPCLPARNYAGNINRRPFSADSHDDNGLIHVANNLPSTQEIINRQSIPFVEMRNYFPETWLWELIPIDDQIDIQRPIPHTITQWTGSAFCMSSRKGLGVSPSASIKSFQPVYLSFSMPYSVFYGETVPLLVTVFNYIASCFPVTITLEQTQDFRLISASNAAKICICKDKTYTHTFYILPQKEGLINMSVSLTSLMSRTSSICANRALFFRHVNAADSITKLLLVKHRGIPAATSKSVYVCANGGTQSQQLPLSLPSDGIVGSTTDIFVNITGDIAAPTIANIGHLIYRPGGCPSQNLAHYFPMFYSAAYLKATNQLSGSLLSNAISILTAGYQNQLRFRQSDGSFSFGSGLTWLTAYVIKAFSASKSLIYIDPTVLSTGINYVVRNQLYDGCFRSEGYWGGGVRDNTPQSGTAFIAISLLESGYSGSSDAINRAIGCINQVYQPTVYLLAMKAYIMALTNNVQQAQTTLNALESSVLRSGDTTYWRNNHPAFHSHDIMTASYALLAMLTINSHTHLASSTARWLISQRNAYGGSSSPEDSMISFQALTRYAVKHTSQSINMAVTLKTGFRSDVVHVNAINRLEIQSRRIGINTDRLYAEYSGQGCSVIQLIIHYRAQGNHRSPEFYLDVKVKPYHSQIGNQYKQTITLCTRYLATDGKSTMALMEIEMASGYQADASQFQTLQNSDAKLRRWETPTVDKVVLYFDELTQNMKCFDIVVAERSQVQDRKPAVIQVYDYYRPEMKVSTEYTLLITPSSIG